MKPITRHFSKVMVAGLVALLPIGGTVLGIMYLESELGEAIGPYVPDALRVGDRPFPGLGLLLVVAIIYVTGLLVSTFLGRWMWGVFDGILTRLPMLGMLYNTLKQILGYAEGGDAVFLRVVYVKDPDMQAEELGLVTNTTGPDGDLVVFVPGSPMPTSGRLIVVPEVVTRASEMSVKDALAALVSIGKSDIEPAPE